MKNRVGQAGKPHSVLGPLQTVLNALQGLRSIGTTPRV